MSKIVSEIRESLRPDRLVPSIVAGVVAGILAITFMFSYSAVMFTEDLAIYVPRATGGMLFGGVVIAVMVSLFGAIRGAVADFDGDGDPDEIHIRLEVAELNGGSSLTEDPVTQYQIAPGVRPGLWVFAPKFAGMAVENFESNIARSSLRLPSPAIRPKKMLTLTFIRNSFQ